MQNAACPLISPAEKRGASDPHLTIYGMHAPLLRRNGEIVFIGSERRGGKGGASARSSHCRSSTPSLVNRPNASVQLVSVVLTVLKGSLCSFCLAFSLFFFFFAGCLLLCHPCHPSRLTRGEPLFSQRREAGSNV